MADKVETLGQRIFTLRKLRKMSQNDLAEKADMDFTYISKIERDRVPPSQSKLERIAKALDTSVEELQELAARTLESKWNVGIMHRLSDHMPSANIFLMDMQSKYQQGQLTDKHFAELRKLLDELVE